MTESLEIRNLNISFLMADGELPVAKNINLHCRNGHITGLIGESGSGKSIVGMSILGLLPENTRIDGEIMFQGKNLLELTESELEIIRGKNIGFIPQNPANSFDPMKTIGSQLMEVLIHHNKANLSISSLRDMARESLAELGFCNPEEIMQSYSFSLSGGMNQRALCTLGTIAQPGWLIADEPTKGLDTILRKEMYTFFKRCKTKGMSILIITHDLSLAEHLCDEIGVMKEGELIEFGSSFDIIKNPQNKYTKELLAARPSELLKEGWYE